MGLLAAGLAVCLPGCGRGGTLRTDVSEVMLPGIQAGDGNYSIGRMMADLRHEQAALRGLQHDGSPTVKVDPCMQSSSSVEEVARSIASNLAEWEEHCRELDSAGWMNGIPSETASEPASPSSFVDQDSAKQSSEVRRKHAVEYVNCQMRIALLESRLEKAGDSDREVLTKKLEQARAALQAVDAACEAEIELQNRLPQAATSEPQNPGDTESWSMSKLGPTDRPEDYPINKSVNEIRTDAKRQEVWGRSYGSPAEGYGKAIADTCENIDRAILLLERSKNDLKDK